MTKTRQLCIHLAIFGVIGLTGPSVVAQPDDNNTESIRCLKLNRIDNIDIVDNSHLVFQTGINEYYLNTLPYACNGLRLNDSLMYRTSLNEICNVDVVTVLNTIGPAGYQEGPSCGLGMFEPISREEIKTLKDTL